MARWLLLLTSVLFWASSAVMPVTGINDSSTELAHDPIDSNGSARVLQKQVEDEARQSKMEEDKKLRQEIEEAVRAQEAEKAHREMQEKHMRELEKKHKKELEARRKRDMEEEEKRKREEEARRQKEEEARRQKEEEEHRRKEAEEAERKRKEEAERKQREEEERRKREEEEELNFQHILDTKIIPELKQRCSTFPKWTSAQVERCLSFAEDGIEYDPLIFDLDDDDFSFVMNPVEHSLEHESITTRTMLKVVFVMTLVVTYLRHVNWFRKSQMWNLAVLKIRAIINSKHRHVG